jgi:F-type H+-transporting ATPase subunit gamma
MANLHDIERRISSVSSTKQITRTMEMVSAAKIRVATSRMEYALPWANSILDMMIKTSKLTKGDMQPLLEVHEDKKKVLVCVIASDRGLAGGFNTNILRHAERLIKAKQAAGMEVEVAACGKKAIGYMTYRGIKPVIEFVDKSADPTFEQAYVLAKYVTEQYTVEENPLDEIYVLFNHAKNAAEQTIVTEQVLPVSDETYEELFKGTSDDLFEEFTKDNKLRIDEDEKKDGPIYGDIDFEPGAEEVLKYLLEEYLRNAFFYALLDSAAGEQGARRNAMKSATDNANEMISTLTRIYNRVRQGAITTEITEIVGGAAALEE